MTEAAITTEVTWPWLVALTVGLAALDFLGAVFAKAWTNGRNPWMFTAGAITFLALFVLFAVALRWGDLTTITFGWIVLLQVGVILLERLRYGVGLPPGKWLAMIAILGLQGYLIVGPAPARATPVAPQAATTVVASGCDRDL